MPTSYTPEILFEDNHIIIINKKSGDIVQGDKTGDAPLNDLLKAYIKKKYNKPGNVYLGTVHRLDRPTSGIVMFAKTSKALTRLNKMFQDKQINKIYWAVTEGQPPAKSGHLVDYLLKNEKQNKSYPHIKPVDKSKKAELEYTYKAKGDRYFYLEINPLTGRHHQIRVQLSNIKCIIKGDLKYGAKRPNKDGSIHLHARKLIFEHPIKKEIITVIAPVPNEPLWLDFQSKAGQ